MVRKPGYAIVLLSFLLFILGSLESASSNPAPGSQGKTDCTLPAQFYPAACGAPPGCVRYVMVAGQGDSCPADHGAWWVRLRDGSHVFTHGADSAAISNPSGTPPPPSGDRHGVPPTPYGPASYPGSIFPPTINTTVPPVHCTPVSDYHMLAIYAVAFDDTDAYATMEATVRTMINDTNSFLFSEAREFGQARTFKYACNSKGYVQVDHAVLPTAKASANFGNIVSDLVAKGYNDGKTKYVIYYDDTAAGGPAAGIGTIAGDDTLVVSNANNHGPSYAVDFGYPWGVIMHENGHNLGTTQLSAPDTTGAWHCNDPMDTMCYNDGGPTGTQVTKCTDHTHYDCNHDDYFHPKPSCTGASVNYLCTHWNIGDPIDRYLFVGNATQCADGVDNDGDHLMDERDLGCSSPQDDDESFPCPQTTPAPMRGHVDLGARDCHVTISQPACSHPGTVDYRVENGYQIACAPVQRGLDIFNGLFI